MVVMIYGFSGRYTGNGAFEWDAPSIGARHRAMLFLPQEDERDAFDLALAECIRFGFDGIQDLRCGRMQVDALNCEAYRGFSVFYEEALEAGSALLYYPQTLA
ncbi:MAG: hypothetical protein LBV10_03990 [Stenotrophomonas sp.]|jgi:hypothetical protein|uniref:hypothetical protein n=1 Tax=Stenotrophomonas sp. TaxID=69392 RepID=UPI002842088C|nr:hypothetical protein [Stenotrophomonas sp.]MDR2958681.1 hypothetical protein [Stenotrophomonas sp.]